MINFFLRLPVLPIFLHKYWEVFQEPIAYGYDCLVFWYILFFLLAFFFFLFLNSWQGTDISSAFTCISIFIISFSLLSFFSFFFFCLHSCHLSIRSNRSYLYNSQSITVPTLLYMLYIYSEPLCCLYLCGLQFRLFLHILIVDYHDYYKYKINFSWAFKIPRQNVDSKAKNYFYLRHL